MELEEELTALPERYCDTRINSLCRLIRVVREHPRLLAIKIATDLESLPEKGRRDAAVAVGRCHANLVDP